MHELKGVVSDLRKAGFTYQDIGTILGYTTERARQIDKDIHCALVKTKIPIKWKPKSNIVYTRYKHTEGVRHLSGGIEKLRELVRIRDNHTCQICGKVWKRGQRRFDVHHMDREKEGKNGFIYENNKYFDRMITLCHRCHLNLEHLGVRKKV